MNEQELDNVRELARFVRAETVRLVGIAGSGHYTSVFSAAEILALLYGSVLNLSDDPDWPDRDRFILSKGHCAVGVYPLLARRGYISDDVLNEYTRLGNPLGDHPDMRRVPGIDFSSGSLGHGLSIGVGMAYVARHEGRSLQVYVLLGDQELNEGQIWEAAQEASQFGLGNLVAIVDRNGMGLDGRTSEIMSPEPIAGRFESFGWDCVEVDGHHVQALHRAMTERDETATRPYCIVANTVKGKGVGYMEMSRTWHLGYLAAGDAADTLREIRENE